MKKIILKLVTGILLSIILSTGISAFAEKVNTEELMPDYVYRLWDKDNKGSAEKGIGNDQLKAVEALPKISAEQIISVAILQILEWTFVLTVIAIVVAAIYYIIGRGNDEDITKAKNIILYLIIGMAIIGASYGIIAGITQLTFSNLCSF